MKISRLVRIHGHVQGVFFRESLKAEAKRLGITGWVRNRRDGTVEALVQGEEAPVSEILNWCHQGPPAAKVNKVYTSPVENETALAEFLRLETE